MANFSVSNSTALTVGNAPAALTTTYKTQIVINNSTTSTNTLGSGGVLRRGKLYDILVGTNGTPADGAVQWDIIRVAGGTSTPLAGGISSFSSLFALDPADNFGFVNCAGINSTIETAFTASVEAWYVGVNARASYRWVAAPGSEIVWPAVASGANNGLAGRALAVGGTYTGTATLNWLWQEQ